MPRTPNIIHTANMRVKAMVLSVSTRRRAESSARSADGPEAGFAECWLPVEGFVSSALVMFRD
jgi:hypothetical protein